MKRMDGTSGQTMVFGAISLFILVSFTALVFNAGQVVSHRVEIQNAADAAARSGALTEANAVSSVAFFNDGMAYIYYNMIRYSTNVTVFGTLAALKQAGAPDSATGPDPAGKYAQALQEAELWMPRCEEWIRIIARTERAIAVSTEELVKREIRRSAIENARHPTGTDAQGAEITKGVEAVALFPDFTFMPRPGANLHITIDQFEPNNGWKISTDPPWSGYPLTIWRDPATHDWTISNSTDVFVTIHRIGPNHFTLTSGGQTMEIDRPTADHAIVILTGPNPVDIDCQFLDGIGWAVDARSATVSVTYTPFDDATRGKGYTVTANPGGTVSIRRGPDGRLQEWNGAGWVNIPGTLDEITIGGKVIPVQQSSTLALPGNASLDLPNTIHIGGLTYYIPDTVYVGGTSITLRDDSVRIAAALGPASFVIDDMGPEPTLTINGLTLADADGKWRPLSEHATRQRLAWQRPENHSYHHWFYDYSTNASYFLEDSIDRLALHAVQDNDPYVQVNRNSQPAWTEWLDPNTGRLDATAYHRSYTPVDQNGDPIGPTIRVSAKDIMNDANKAYMDFSDRINKLPRPLRLSDDFLKFGINVAVWRDKDTAILEGGQKGVLRFNLFENPSWGYFGVASARCAFMDNTQNPPRWVPTFDTSTEISVWVAQSHQNLYEPVWTAMLVSTREAIRSEHIESIPPDTGTNFMWRGLAGGHYTWLDRTYGGATWHDPDPADQYPHILRPRDDVSDKFMNMRNRQGDAFDHTSPNLPDAIDH